MAELEPMMILPTGRGAKGRTLRAFTLIELIVVMTLIAFVVAIALPRLSTFFRGRSLDSEARKLLALCHQGASRAASEGVPVVLWVDIANRKYGLEEDSSYTDRDSKAVECDLDREVQMRVVNSSSSASGAASALLTATVATSGTHNALPGIRFLPDGSIAESSPQSVQLRDSSGVTLALARSRNRWMYEIQSVNN
jgi:prepilin-type N-terminal cleavage/methylation domain-containing protein